MLFVSNLSLITSLIGAVFMLLENLMMIYNKIQHVDPASMELATQLNMWVAPKKLCQDPLQLEAGVLVYSVSII